jgi:tRNA(fMet)-specific endonuclease VapC
MYLLDTNICIFYFKGRFRLLEKFKEAGIENCFISEITLAELKFGIANSQNIKQNQKTLSEFLAGLQIIPIFPALDLYASEKARLRKSGLSTEEFDLLIGASAVCHGLTMVTNNVSHFEKIKGIVIQDWTKPEFNSFISTD